MKLYKLTDQNGNTRGGTHWDAKVTHSLPHCGNPSLCSGDVLHAYTNPNLALLINPIGANIINPILWEAEGEPCTSDWGKVGCFTLTTTKKLRLPTWTKNNKAQKVQIAFAILCAKSVLQLYEDWYPQDDRVRKAIEAAQEYLKNPSNAAAYARIDFGVLADEAVRMVMHR